MLGSVVSSVIWSFRLRWYLNLVVCEELDRLSRTRLEALLADNRAEIALMLEPESEACRAAKRESEEALQIALANLGTHMLEHGCADSGMPPA